MTFRSLGKKNNPPAKFGFHPYIFAETHFKRSDRPSTPTFALSGLSHLCNFNFEVEDIGKPLDQLLPKALELCQQHHLQSGGSIAFWGKVDFYVFHYSEDIRFQINRDGKTFFELKNMNQSNLKQIHSHSFRNETELARSSEVGCFYCLATFEPSEVVDWIDETTVPKVANTGERTALCPACGIDSVIGNASGYEINHALLTTLRDEFFKFSLIRKEDLGSCLNATKNLTFINIDES